MSPNMYSALFAIVFNMLQWGGYGDRNYGLQFSYPKTGLSSTGGSSTYAIPSESPRGDMDMKKSCLSDDTESHGRINDELADSMSFYYENVSSKDDGIRGGGVLELIDVLGERDRPLCLESIFKTGLTPEEYSRSGKLLANGANPKVRETLKRASL